MYVHDVMYYQYMCTSTCTYMYMYMYVHVVNAYCSVRVVLYMLSVWQGFICPICMEALRSAEALQVHWEAAHSTEGGGASATPPKPKAAPWVHIHVYVCMYNVHVHVQCSALYCTYVCTCAIYSVHVCTCMSFSETLHDCVMSPLLFDRPAVPAEPVKYVPPPLEPDEDELEHYKTQVKIMTDLINVCVWELGEGELGVGGGGWGGGGGTVNGSRGFL